MTRFATRSFVACLHRYAPVILRCPELVHISSISFIVQFLYHCRHRENDSLRNKRRLLRASQQTQEKQRRVQKADRALQGGRRRETENMSDYIAKKRDST
jgi:hypothetical protein